MLQPGGLYQLVAVLLVAAASNAQARFGLPDFTGLVRENAPAVVNISTSQKATEDGSREMMPRRQLPPPDHRPFDDDFQQFLDDQLSPKAYDAQSLGSGFIISKDGYILTNAHVVVAANQIIVRLSDRREFEAQLVGTDKRSDLAVLKIPARGLPTVTIGKSAVQVGEWVLAIGSPFGFEHSVTAGIVSATGRNLPSEDYVPFIQTDVAINPGNSGGPLINLDGEVVGVNSHIYTRTGGFMGLSFAIPIGLAVNVADQLRDSGQVTRGWLGVLIQDVSRTLAKSFGMDRPEGALVSRVIPHSPAARAGLQVGDVIVGYGGHEVSVSGTLPPMVGRTGVGENVPLTVIRAGQLRQLHAIIAKLPSETQLSGKRLPQKTPAEVEQLGLTVKSLSQDQRHALGLGVGDPGVMVAEVRTGSARAAGIHQGDIIRSINRQPIESAMRLQEVVDALQAGHASVPVLIRRDGRYHILSLYIGE